MRFLITLLFLLINITSIYADEPNKPKTWTILGGISCSSLKKLEDNAKKLNIPLPPFLNALFIEKQFTFIGDGNLDDDKNIGIFFVGGKDITSDQMAFFVLPLKNNGPSLQTAQNGVPYKDSKDTFILGGITTFRVTKDYLIFGAFSEAIANFDFNFLTEDFKNINKSLNLKVNLKGLRETAPELMDIFIQSINKETVESKEADNANHTDPYNYGEKQGKELVLNFIKRLESANCSLEINNDDDIHFNLDVDLIKLNYKQSDPIFQNGKGSSISFSHNIIQEELQKINEGAFDDKKYQKIGYSQKDISEIKNSFFKIFNLICLGTSSRVSYKIIKNEYAITVVKKLKSKNELSEYVKDLNESLIKTSKILGEDILCKLEVKKTANNMTFNRLHFTNFNYTEFTIDFYEENNYAYCVLSKLGVTNPAELFSKPESGDNKVINLAIDLFQFLSDFRIVPDNEIFNSNESSFKAISDALNGTKPITLNISVENNKGKITLDVNKNIINLIMKNIFLEKMNEENINSKTLDAYAKRIKESPDVYQLYYDRAELYISQNNLEKALEDLEFAQSLNPKTNKILKKLMEIHLLKEDFAKVQSYSTILKKEFINLAFAPYFIDYQMGVIKGDPAILKKAKEDFSLIIAIKPQKNIKINMMEFLIGKIDQKTLLELSMREIKEEKESLAIANYLIALKAMENKNYSEAKLYLNKCIEVENKESKIITLIAKKLLEKL